MLYLRKEHRILGQLVGQLPVDSLAPFAKSTQGLPLQLSLHEVYCAFQLGIVRIVRNVDRNLEGKIELPSPSKSKQLAISTQRKSDSAFIYEEVETESPWLDFFEDAKKGEKRKLLQLAFDSLWRRGFYVHLSNRFQTDLVVYTADPLLVHASFLVVCVPTNQKLRIRDMMCYARLANSVKKTLLFAFDGATAKIPTFGAKECTLASETFSDHPSSSSDPSTSSTPFLAKTHSQAESIQFLQFGWVGVS